MERIHAETNGRPVYNSDLLLLQSELLDALKSSWSNRGAFILSGCVVTGTGPYNVSSGYVFINNEVMRFEGATGVTLPRYIVQGTPQLTEYKEYKDAVSRPTRRVIKATLSGLVGSGEFITLSAGGGRPYGNAFPEFVNVVGTQAVNGNKTFNGNNTFTGGNTFTGAVTNSNTINGTGTISLSNTIQGTQFVSTVPTGSAPLSVASTTKVANLNADLLDGLDSSNFASSAISVSAGTGLTGGGQLNTSRTISVATQGITTSLLADSAVTAGKIADANVTQSKLADNSVSTNKIIDNNVTTSKINDFAITTSKITSAAVTTDKIANGNVTAAKLGSDVMSLFPTIQFRSTAYTLTVTSDTAVNTANLPGMKIGFWCHINMTSTYANIGHLVYRHTAVGGNNILQQLGGHYHTGTGASISTSNSATFSWFVPCPPTGTGTFGMGHYVGSGATATITIWAYI